MTGLVAERAHRVIAIEIDPKLATELQQQFGGNPRIEILQADFLSVDVAALCLRGGTRRCCVFGNLPYYITSPIIRHLLHFSDSIRTMNLLVQREVAERMTALPGSRNYGYLSVLTQVYSQPRIVLRVPPGAFSPPPKVHSALVAFQMTPSFPGVGREERERLLEFARRSFASKRKTLLNNLAGAYSRSRLEQVLPETGIGLNTRAEQVPLDQLLQLSRRLSHLPRE